MLISVRELARYWGLQPKSILHVGAHRLEEAAAYRQAGWGIRSIVWVEANPVLADLAAAQLKDRPNEHVLQALAWARSGEKLTFNVASNGESSSALPFSEHAEAYPQIRIVETMTVISSALKDEPVVAANAPYDLINLDIQGSELMALAGLGEIASQARAIYSEVNVRELYKGCARLPEMDALLGSWGFVRLDSQMTPKGWGDALWLKEQHVPPFPKLRRQLRRTQATGTHAVTGLGRRLGRLFPVRAWSSSGDL